MVRERVGRDIIGLNERSVEKISQSDVIARLKTNVIFKGAANASCGTGIAWLRSPDLRSAQSSTTLAAAIFVRLPTCSFFLDSCSSKM